MIKFIKKIIKFLVLICFTFLLTHLGLDAFFGSNFVCNKTWVKLYNGEINAEVAIIGNSRAEAHYNPKIISHKTEFEVYNLGLSGTPLNILNIRWNSYINRNKLPRVLILDVDYNMLGSSDKIVDKFQYLPFIWTKEYETVAKQIDKDYAFEKYIPLYKYRGYHKEVFTQIKKRLFNDCYTVNKGFVEHEEVWNEGNWANFRANRMEEISDAKEFESIYKQGAEELKEIITFCKEKKIKVYMLWSPQYYEVQEYKQQQRAYVDKLLLAISETHNVDYINFSKDSLVYNKANFYDHSHLNKVGSDLFSAKVGDIINTFNTK